jgi:hypothetical protein
LLGIFAKLRCSRFNILLWISLAINNGILKVQSHKYLRPEEVERLISEAKSVGRPKVRDTVLMGDDVSPFLPTGLE